MKAVNLGKTNVTFNAGRHVGIEDVFRWTLTEIILARAIRRCTFIISFAFPTNGPRYIICIADGVF